ncbi:hypothetical protein KC19_9G023100 [Ceratodon purpureus]|uniref:Uncharacterized protein n=1 Tax=Ceratodon purpureus TaxID=3225 RepID=A0A8T0GRG9_CERPU|nr:hypothetical protein KC19_9G023100 [Ceratodon purpureus]
MDETISSKNKTLITATKRTSQLTNAIAPNLFNSLKNSTHKTSSTSTLRKISHLLLLPGHTKLKRSTTSSTQLYQTEPLNHSNSRDNSSSSTNVPAPSRSQSDHHHHLHLHHRHRHHHRCDKNFSSARRISQRLRGTKPRRRTRDDFGVVLHLLRILPPHGTRSSGLPCELRRHPGVNPGYGDDDHGVQHLAQFSCPAASELGFWQASDHLEVDTLDR